MSLLPLASHLAHLKTLRCDEETRKRERKRACREAYETLFKCVPNCHVTPDCLQREVESAAAKLEDVQAIGFQLALCRRKEEACQLFSDAILLVNSKPEESAVLLTLLLELSKPVVIETPPDGARFTLEFLTAGKTFPLQAMKTGLFTHHYEGVGAYFDSALRSTHTELSRASPVSDEGFVSGSVTSEVEEEPDLDLWYRHVEHLGDTLPAGYKRPPLIWPGQPVEKPRLCECPAAVFDSWYAEHLAQLAGISATLKITRVFVEEEFFSQQLKLLLLGLDSEVFTRDACGLPHLAPDVVVSGVSHESLLVRVLPLCRAARDFTVISCYAESEGGGVTRRGVRNAARQYLLSYSREIVAAPLQGLLHTSLTPHLARLTRLAQLIVSVEHLTGVSLINALYSYAGVSRWPEAAVLFHFAAKPFLEFLDIWSCSGRLQDPHGEFHIHRNPAVPSSCRDRRFWKCQFVVRGAQASFLPADSLERIFTCGKLMFLFRECEPDHYLLTVETNRPLLELHYSSRFLAAYEANFRLHSGQTEAALAARRSQREAAAAVKQERAAALVTAARLLDIERLAAIDSRVAAVKARVDEKKASWRAELEEEERGRRQRTLTAIRTAEEEGLEDAVTAELEQKVEAELAAELRAEFSRLGDEATAREERAVWRIRRLEGHARRVELYKREAAEWANLGATSREDVADTTLRENIQPPMVAMSEQLIHQVLRPITATMGAEVIRPPRHTSDSSVQQLMYPNSALDERPLKSDGLIVGPGSIKEENIFVVPDSVNEGAIIVVPLAATISRTMSTVSPTDVSPIVSNNYSAESPNATEMTYTPCIPPPGSDGTCIDAAQSMTVSLAESSDSGLVRSTCSGDMLMSSTVDDSDGPQPTASHISDSSVQQLMYPGSVPTMQTATTDSASDQVYTYTSVENEQADVATPEKEEAAPVNHELRSYRLTEARELEAVTSQEEEVAEVERTLAAMMSPLQVTLERCVAAPLLRRSQLADSAAVTLLRDEGQLLRHLVTIRDYVLLAHSHFATTLADRLFPCNRPTTSLLHEVVRDSPVSFSCSTSRLQLRYSAPWPVSLVISPATLDWYGEISALLLEQRRVLWCLEGIFNHLKEAAMLYPAHSGRIALLHSHRFVMRHFVDAFQSYLAGTFQAEWKVARQKLNRASSLDCLHETHKLYVSTLLNKSFLLAGGRVVRSHVDQLSSLVLKFDSQVRSQLWFSHPTAFSVLCQTGTTFSDQTRSLVSYLRTRTQAAHHSILLAHLTSNSYYD